MSITPQQIVYGSWFLFGIYWFVSAFRAKKTEKREPSAERLGHMILMAAGYILLFQRNDNWGASESALLARHSLDRLARRRHHFHRRFIRHLGALESGTKLERRRHHQTRPSNHSHGTLRLHSPPDLHRYARRRNWIGAYSGRISRSARFRNYSVRLLSKGPKGRKIPRRQFRRAISGAQAAHWLFFSAFFVK